MTLVKTTPTPVKTLAVVKTAVFTSTGNGKSPLTMKKPVDVTSSLKKPPAPSSPIKGKSTSVPMKPATKAEPSVVKVAKSPIKVEKSPSKLKVTKASVDTTIKSSPAANKSPVSKSPPTETRTPIRNVVKPISTPRMQEQKQLDSKKETSTVRSSEKLTANKTNVISGSVSKMPNTPSSAVKNILSSPVKSVLSPTKSKAPSKSSSVVKNSFSSPVKSVSSAIRSVSSPIKSISSPVKSISSPIKSISSPVKPVSSPIKSISSPVKSVSSPIKSISSPVKSVSSPTKSISSPVKSLSSSMKSISSPVKSVSSPAKSISSLLKSTLSPIKPKTTREMNLSIAGKTKNVTASQHSPNSLIKKSLNLLKSTQSAIGKSPTPKVIKSNSISIKTMVKKLPTITSTDDVSNLSPCCAVEKVDCHCDYTMEKNEESSNSMDLITEYTIDNTSNFDVVQAFKVAEQLIKIQSSDRNLETIIETCENNSVINWDDVITPCDDFAVSSSNDEIKSISMEQNDLTMPSFNTEESASKCEICIIETTNPNNTANSQVLVTKSNEQNNKLVLSTNRDENNNINELTDITGPSSIHSQFSKIELNDEKYFTNELPSTPTDDDSIQNHYEENEFAEIELNGEYLTKELSFDYTNDLIENHCDENELPEWTITIDEFSIDLHQKEIQFSDVVEKENYIADETPCTVGLSYADILKKNQKVLANSTNLELPKKEPKLCDDKRMKSYQTPKKNKASFSKNTLFDIENNYQNCDYLYEEPEYCETRKKKYKKIKHLSKRHLRNINRECEYIESRSDIFVTHVWKDIY